MILGFGFALRKTAVKLHFHQPARTLRVLALKALCLHKLPLVAALPFVCAAGHFSPRRFSRFFFPFLPKDSFS